MKTETQMIPDQLKAWLQQRGRGSREGCGFSSPQPHPAEHRRTGAGFPGSIQVLHSWKHQEDRSSPGYPCPTPPCPQLSSTGQFCSFCLSTNLTPPSSSAFSSQQSDWNLLWTHSPPSSVSCPFLLPLFLLFFSLGMFRLALSPDPLSVPLYPWVYMVHTLLCICH